MFNEHCIDEAVRTDPRVCRDLIDGIDPIYYSPGEFDAVAHELSKLSDSNIDLSLLDEDIKRKFRQLSAINKTFSDLVMENYNSYEVELDKVTELTRCLENTLQTCKCSRSYLQQSVGLYTSRSLSLVKNHRKKMLLRNLLNHLKTIRTLYESETKLKTLLASENYSSAVKLLLEGCSAADCFNQYHCISDLSAKLRNTLVNVEEEMKGKLERFCRSFHEPTYLTLQHAFCLLDKSHVAVDELLIHFSNAIFQTAFSIVSGYVVLFNAAALPSTLQRQPLADLCKSLDIKSFMQCLLDLCKALWDILVSYLKIVRWHSTNNHVLVSERPQQVDENDTSLQSNYVMQKLEQGLQRIWLDILQKIKIVITTVPIKYLEFSDFIKVLDIAKRLMGIGQRYCQNESADFAKTMHQQTIGYFRNFHMQTLESLHVFLENEGWELCPVKSSFRLTDLLEFRFLKLVLGVDLYAKVTSYSALDAQNDEDSEPADTNANSYNEPDTTWATSNPFDLIKYDEFSGRQESIFADEKSADEPDDADETTQVAPDSAARRAVAPPMANATLLVLRLFGKYLQMQHVLRTIVFDVVEAMSQLFDFYLYCVNDFFASDCPAEFRDRLCSEKMRSTLGRIAQNVRERNAAGDAHPPPAVSPLAAADLRLPTTLFGLRRRVVAVESVAYLADQFKSISDYLAAVIPAAKRPFLQQFHSQTLSTVAELRDTVLLPASLAAIDRGWLVRQIADVKWDLKDIESQQNKYVDELLNRLKQFGDQTERVADGVPLNESVRSVLWQNCVRIANRAFVDGFGSVKSCTNEGRGRMQLDYQHFLKQLERLCSLRASAFADRDYVEMYVRAYYLPDEQLLAWIREHHAVYGPKLLLALVAHVTHVSKRWKKTLAQAAQDPNTPDLALANSPSTGRTIRFTKPAILERLSSIPGPSSSAN